MNERKIALQSVILVSVQAGGKRWRQPLRSGDMDITFILLHKTAEHYGKVQTVPRTEKTALYSNATSLICKHLHRQQVNTELVKTTELC